MMRELAAHFLALAEKQGSTVPLMVGHRNMGVSLLHTGDIEEALVHIDQAMALYDPVEHRQLATRFGQDVRVALSFYQSLARWPLGYPEVALADADRAIKDARDIGQAATLMAALTLTSLTHIHCGSYPAAKLQLDEAITLADEKGALFWKTGAMLVTGCLLAATGKDCGRRFHDYSRAQCLASNRNNGVDAGLLCVSGKSSCGPRPFR